MTKGCKKGETFDLFLRGFKKERGEFPLGGSGGRPWLLGALGFVGIRGIIFSKKAAKQGMFSYLRRAFHLRGFFPSNFGSSQVG